MTRPRRSHHWHSTRSCLRYLARDGGTSTTYRAVGRTLITEAAQRVNTAGLARRVECAEAAHAQASADLDEAACAVDAVKIADADLGHPPHYHSAWSSVVAHEVACIRRLNLAEAELAAAKRNASRPVGELVTPRHAEVYRSVRTWPNALPGGTSPRRAAIARRPAARALLVGVRSSKTIAGAVAAMSADFRAQVLSFGQAIVVGEA